MRAHALGLYRKSHTLLRCLCHVASSSSMTDWSTHFIVLAQSSKRAPGVCGKEDGNTLYANATTSRSFASSASSFLDCAPSI